MDLSEVVQPTKPIRSATVMPAMCDELLIRLFGRHFDDPIAALRRLDAYLALIRLPFDLGEKLRELSFPPQPRLPNGVPSLIYYFVSDAQRGTGHRTSHSPLHPSFINTADGIGQNLGCPVRLLRALDALAQLSEGDREPPMAGLRNAREHLSTVEELLWLTGWESPALCRRGGQFRGMSGDVDWRLTACGHPIFVEAKFRRSDWVRLSDGDKATVKGEGFLARAAHKFPEPPQCPALHVVGITTVGNINEDIVHEIGHELGELPQIHVVVVRSLLQMTHVISLSVEIRNRILGLLTVPKTRDFPVNYSVFFHREQRDERILARTPGETSFEPSKAVCWSITPEGPHPYPILEAGIYRLNILSPSPDGEPHFEIVPRYPPSPQP